MCESWVNYIIVSYLSILTSYMIITYYFTSKEESAICLALILASSIIFSEFIMASFKINLAVFWVIWDFSLALSIIFFAWSSASTILSYFESSFNWLEIFVFISFNSAFWVSRLVISLLFSLFSFFIFFLI